MWFFYRRKFSPPRPVGHPPHGEGPRHDPAHEERHGERGEVLPVAHEAPLGHDGGLRLGGGEGEALAAGGEAEGALIAVSSVLGMGNFFIEKIRLSFSTFNKKAAIYYK